MNIDTFLGNRRFLFWVLQLVGWFGWAFVFYLGVLFWNESPGGYLIYLPIVATIGLCLSLGLRKIYQLTWNWDKGRRIVVVLAGSWLAGSAWMASRHAIYYDLFPDMRKPYMEYGMEFFAYLEGGTTATWVMLVWSSLYLGAKYYMLLQEERQRGLKMTSMAHEAQLKMLRYQLNPHFLFNTLNAISTLVLDKDTGLANTMLTRLSRFLRYSLDSDPMQKVTVAEEVEALRLYLDIEKVRFGERLELKFNVEPEAREALLPSLLLQPLVENSIKYAIAPAINGGTIAVSARAFGGELLLTVADDGAGLDLEHDKAIAGGGVGIANTRGRLREIYGADHGLRLSTTEPHGLTITIRIPLEKKPREVLPP